MDDSEQVTDKCPVVAIRVLLGDAQVTRSSRGTLNKGARLQMGMVRRQNEALTSKLVLGVRAEAERIWGTVRSDTKWSLAHSEVKRTEMEDAVCFTLVPWHGTPGGGSTPGLTQRTAQPQLLDGDTKGK